MFFRKLFSKSSLLLNGYCGNQVCPVNSSDDLCLLFCLILLLWQGCCLVVSPFCLKLVNGSLQGCHHPVNLLPRGLPPHTQPADISWLKPRILIGWIVLGVGFLLAIILWDKAYQLIETMHPHWPVFISLIFRWMWSYWKQKISGENKSNHSKELFTFWNYTRIYLFNLYQHF